MSVFGEIQLGQSRAVSDDEDDELLQSQLKENEHLKRKIYWLKEETQRIQVDEIIISDGYLTCAFIHTYLLNQLSANKGLNILGLSATQSEYKVHMTNNEHEKHEHSISKIKNNFIYVLENFGGKSYAICELYHQLKPTEIYDWINQLWERIEFKSALIFSSHNKSGYFGKSESKFPLVRYISSEVSTSIDNGICSRLEEPNFLGNLPAGMIHFCLSKNLPFFTFICYSATLGIDLHSIKEIFNAVRTKLGEKSLFLESDLSKKTLSMIERMETSTNNLYM